MGNFVPFSPDFHGYSKILQNTKKRVVPYVSEQLVLHRAFNFTILQPEQYLLRSLPLRWLESPKL